MPARTPNGSDAAQAPVPAPLPAPMALVPPPPAAPHSAAAQSPEEQERNSRLQAKALALRNAPRAVPITDIAIILGMRTKDSGRQEIMYDINPSMRILKCTHEVVEKVRAVTEEGQFLGYEPTGEYEFTLKVKYLKE